MLRLETAFFDCNDRDKRIVLTGEPGRIYHIDAIYADLNTSTALFINIDDVFVADLWLLLKLWAPRVFYFVFEHTLGPGENLIFQQWKDFPGGMDLTCHILYHDLPSTVTSIPDSYPYPYNPNFPPYPFILIPPTPVVPVDPDPDWPPTPVVDPWPPWPPDPPWPPYPEVKYEELPYPEFEDVPDFKTAIPITISQKNKLLKTPYVTSSLRPSFFPSQSSGKRSQTQFNYTKAFSHQLAEGIFNTIPLRSSETGQSISTNTKDDYKVLSLTHDHANYTDYFYMMPFTHLTLKPGAAAWKLKVLTVYNWLSKVDISEMDEIDLAADKESYFPFYAIGFSLQCPTASGGSPQTITGMVEF